MDDLPSSPDSGGEAGATDRAEVLSQVFQPEAQLADSESRYCIAWPNGPQDVEPEPPNFFNRIAEDSGTISRGGGRGGNESIVTQWIRVRARHRLPGSYSELIRRLNFGESQIEFRGGFLGEAHTQN